MITSAYSNALKTLDEYHSEIPDDCETIREVEGFWYTKPESAKQWYLKIFDCHDELILAGFDDGKSLFIMERLAASMESTWFPSGLERGCPELKGRAKRFYEASKKIGKN